MRTRTLLLLSVACGLVIMLAGAILLFQLSTGDDVTAPTPVGEPVRVGDMSVTVTEFVETAGTLRVSIAIGGTDDAAPVDEFRVIASGRPVSPAASTCPPIDGAVVSCEIEFDVSGADGVSRVLFYDRGEESARWVLG